MPGVILMCIGITAIMTSLLMGFLWSHKKTPFVAIAVAFLGAVIFLLGSYCARDRGEIEEPDDTDIVPSIMDVRMFRPIGPFCSGTCNPESVTSRTSMKVISDELSDADLSFIIIIGGADQRALTDRVAANYCSNVGLAQARGGWVRDFLIDTLSTEVGDTPVMVLPSGPRHVGPKVTEEQLRADRMVWVYALYRQPL